MYNKYDEELFLLNKRYQDIFYSTAIQRDIKFNKYKNYILNLQFKQIMEDVFFKLFIRIPSSQKGNNTPFYPKTKNDLRGKKIAVYSCIVGNYDKIIDPIHQEENVDYFMFTDLELPPSSKWKKIDISKFPEYKSMTAKQINRKIKMLSYKYLSQYDYSVYVDGLIEIVTSVTPMIEDMGEMGLGVHYHNQRDCVYDEAIMIKYAKKADMSIVKKQLNDYKANGFPTHYGLYENTILIRNHHDKNTNKLMDAWWNEYIKYPTRDQLSLPYLIWKNNLKNNIFILGDNLNRNPRFNRGLKHN